MHAHRHTYTHMHTQAHSQAHRYSDGKPSKRGTCFLDSHVLKLSPFFPSNMFNKRIQFYSSAPTSLNWDFDLSDLDYHYCFPFHPNLYPQCPKIIPRISNANLKLKAAQVPISYKYICMQTTQEKLHLEQRVYFELKNLWQSFLCTKVTLPLQTILSKIARTKMAA